ncbi:MAG: ATP-binding cassette domain-containing protein [Defluviitaleaceae bacterium]|nr:ATP-binding cassette domain-containing protein [Defluviitaleaceae bacterium]
MQYGNFNALADINISVRQGGIYGLIGENGAGKTTLLRIITGLSVPTSGELVLFGKTSKRDLEAARRQIGSIIEAPSLYPEYTAETNLEIQRILLGNIDKTNIKHTLRIVGLWESRAKKVKTFSMGMKQRLGIALGLMGNPQMLVLDEPANGLDPKGLSDLRILLQTLNKEYNLTMLISSHLLNELHQIATDFIIIKNGKIVEMLSSSELTKKCQRYILIQLDDVAAGCAVLDREFCGHVGGYKVLENGNVQLSGHNDDISTVAGALQKNGILVTHISLCEQSLEDYYFAATGESKHE